MKMKIIDKEGKATKEITLPKCFNAKIREDIVAKVLEAKKTMQPYSPSPVAGKQQSDRGKIRHRRHVWQTHYGRGLSRVPRKVMSRRGTQFNWEASGVPHVKGGPRAHPPKVVSMINSKRINKKELKIAFESAISATADKKYIDKKYKNISEKDLQEKNVPFVIASDVLNLKTNQRLNLIKKILGDKINSIIKRKKSKRAGVGKLRGRKHKKNAGMLLVIGVKEKIKTTMFDVINVKELGVMDLAQGGLGRLTMFTEGAIKYLGKLK